MARSAGDESVFHAIACPTRRALLDALMPGELAVLKSAGLVEERAEGRFRYYRLRAEPLAAFDAWVGRYRACIEQQLDALGRVLDAMPDTPHQVSRPTRRRPSS
jgi:hypothetical protein